MQSPSTRSPASPGPEMMDPRLGPGKKLYQEEDIGKLAVMRQSDTSVATKYAMCVAAASVAEFATYPLDLTKTRLQIQGELRSGAKYRGMIQTALGIAREEVSQSVHVHLRLSIYCNPHHERRYIMHAMRKVNSMASCS